MSTRRAFVTALVLFYGGVALVLVGVVRFAGHQSLGWAFGGAGLALVAAGSWVSGRGARSVAQAAPSGRDASEPLVVPDAADPRARATRATSAARGR